MTRIATIAQSIGILPFTKRADPDAWAHATSRRAAVAAARANGRPGTIGEREHSVR